MSVKAAILDFDGTLVDEHTSKPVHGAKEMIDELRTAGLKIAFASNVPGTRFRATESGLYHDLFIGKQEANNTNKGSRDWTHAALQAFEVKPNEIVWLGDTDNDMRSAVNTGVLYFHAAWSDPDYAYGIHVDSPEEFATVVLECFTKTHPWYVIFEGKDFKHKPVREYHMTRMIGGGKSKHRHRLIGYLKDGRDEYSLRIGLGKFLTLNLLGSLYASGITNLADVWTVYPGSKGGTNESLAPFVDQAARLFRDKCKADILIRHTDAVDSGEARRKGLHVGYENQVNTMRLNEERLPDVIGKHVVVVDDFGTKGYSLEMARNLLYQGGAREVTCVSFARYTAPDSAPWHSTQNFIGDFDWNPIQPITYQPGMFYEGRKPFTITKADMHFDEALTRIYDDAYYEWPPF